MRVGRGRVWQGIRGWFRSGDRKGTRGRPRPASSGVTTVAGATSGVIPMRGLSRRAVREWTSPDDPASPNESVDTSGMAGVVAIDRARASEERDLLDFLAADIDPIPADPVFRERLREELWAMVLDGQLARSEET